MLFIVFQPQFVVPELGSVILQFIILASSYIIIAFGTDMQVASMSNQLGKWLSANSG